MDGAFFGLATVDLVYVLERYPSENTKARATQFYMSCGGPATNAAIAYGQLGGAPLLITQTGQGLLGRQIQDECARFQCNIRDIAQPDYAPTLSSIILSGNGACRTVFTHAAPPQQIVSGVAQARVFDFDPSDAKIILLDGFFLDIFTPIVRDCRLRGVRDIIFDGGSWKDGTELVLPMVRHALLSSSFRPPGAATTEETIQYLINKGVENVCITNDDKPILCWSSGKGMRCITPPSVAAVDTLGAGDVFHGAFAFAVARTELELFDAVEFAARVASRRCEYYGPREGVTRFARDNGQINT